MQCYQTGRAAGIKSNARAFEIEVIRDPVSKHSFSSPGDMVSGQAFGIGKQHIGVVIRENPNVDSCFGTGDTINTDAAYCLVSRFRSKAMQEVRHRFRALHKRLLFEVSFGDPLPATVNRHWPSQPAQS